MVAILTGRWYNINGDRFFVMNIIDQEIHGFKWSVNTSTLKTEVIRVPNIKHAHRSKKPVELMTSPKSNTYAAIELDI